jgi:Outer membrane protein beta-barrel domain
MKKLLFVLFILFIFSFSHAQTYLGLRGGAHLSSIDFDPNIPAESKWFPNVGIAFIHSNLPYRGIQIELNYTQKGFTAEYANGYSASRTYNFLELPLLSRFYIRNSGTQIVINVGPDLFYHFDDSGNEIHPRKFFGERYFVSNYKHDYAIHDLELGILFGLGVFRQFEKTSIQAELRTYYQMTTFVKNDAFRDSRSFLYTLSLAYFFNM